MAVSVAGFKTRFPEFSSVTDVRIQAFLDDATLILSPCAFGDLYDLAVYYYAAHKLYMADLQASSGSGSGGNGGFGVKKRKKVGKLEVEYDTSGFSEALLNDFLRTQYGRDYLDIAKRSNAGAIGTFGGFHGCC